MMIIHTDELNEHGMHLENELVDILKQEIIKEFEFEGLGNPYPDEEILKILKDLKSLL